jgi:hypothetical protein
MEFGNYLLPILAIDPLLLNFLKDFPLLLFKSARIF